MDLKLLDPVLDAIFEFTVAVRFRSFKCQWPFGGCLTTTHHLFREGPPSGICPARLAFIAAQESLASLLPHAWASQKMAPRQEQDASCQRTKLHPRHATHATRNALPLTDHTLIILVTIR